MKITIEKQTCKRCLHTWYPKPNNDGKVEEPTVCPKCKSPYWNKERKENAK